MPCPPRRPRPRSKRKTATPRAATKTRATPRPAEARPPGSVGRAPLRVEYARPETAGVSNGMRLRLKLKFGVRRSAAALALAALVAGAAACDLDGASKKNATAKSDTPSGPRQPRTNQPMPPVAASHGDASAPASAAPDGAWTQLDGRRAKLEDLRGQVV